MHLLNTKFDHLLYYKIKNNENISYYCFFVIIFKANWFT